MKSIRYFFDCVMIVILLIVWGILILLGKLTGEDQS